MAEARHGSLSHKEVGTAWEPSLRGEIIFLERFGGIGRGKYLGTAASRAGTGTTLEVDGG
jgi:hypothetical protein